MTNEQLQTALDRAFAYVEKCAPVFHGILNRHIEKLLEVQAARAEQVTLTEGEELAEVPHD